MIGTSQVFVEGNVAVITGASSGIGRSTALTCAAKGMHVWLVDIDSDDLATAKDVCIAKCVNRGIQVCNKLSFGWGVLWCELCANSSKFSHSLRRKLKLEW